MRILVHEYLTGGGIVDEPQFAALVPEGEGMVRALLRDLADIPGVEIIVTRDHRLDADLTADTRIVRPGEFEATLARAIDAADAVWPIAPETDGILLGTVRRILGHRRRCLASSPDAIAIATSKRATSTVLAEAGVPVVACHVRLDDLPRNRPVVAKPDDGAGCRETRLFGDRTALEAWLNGQDPADLVFQPYVSGEPCSLSALFCEGRARLLCGNRQQVSQQDGEFRFDGVKVGILDDRDGRYARLTSAVARAIPGLWGYCGIDFLETRDGPMVLEVNPRLTTAYDGLREAIGTNPAGLVLGLPDSIEVGRAADDGH